MGFEDINVLVATHKEYWMPDDPMYIPVNVGSALKGPIGGYQRDDQGQNISFANARYCELTALYWGWKNLTCGSLGVVHYRRYFKGSGERGVLTLDEAKRYLAHVDMILPKRRNYYIETIATHYSHTFDGAHISAISSAIEKICPEYITTFNQCVNRRSAHMYNMFIARREVAGAYCDWLFPILDEAESKIDFSCLTEFESRCIGRLSEFLLDVWIEKNKVSYTEVPVIDLEPVNWLVKGSSFLAAKFIGKKYSESF